MEVQAYNIICFYTNWSQYRNGIGKFFPENIDPTLCTHINYAFGEVAGNDIHKREWNDDALFTKIMRLKRTNPNLKIMLSVGGWNARSLAFSEIVSSRQNMVEFTSNSINFIRQYGFDGLDIDWEYPTVRGGKQGDRDGFTQLVKMMRNVFDRENLLLTAALSPNTKTSPTYYNIPELGRNLHFINLMAYDMHGSWEHKTGHISPATEIRDAVEFYLQNGVPAKKIILGLAAYGRTFTLVDAELNGLDSPVSGAGLAGEFTRERGSLAYYEICNRIKNKGWQRKWLTKDQVPYAHNDNQWVGYEDKQSIRIKSQYIKEKGLLGAMIWALDEDDFMNRCGEGKFPLLRTINEELKNNFVDITTTLQTTITTSRYPVYNQCFNYNPAPLYCGRLRGIFMYVDDCRCYILCDQTYAKVMMCPPTLVYNYVNQQCDLPFLVNCYRRV